MKREQLSHYNKQINIFSTKTANLLVSDIHTIQWVSNNSKSIFNYKKNSSIINGTINNLMPVYFGKNHDNNVKNWLATGKCGKMNKTKTIWCRK